MMVYHYYRGLSAYTKPKGDRSLRIATVLLRKTDRWVSLFAKAIKYKNHNRHTTKYMVDSTYLLALQHDIYLSQGLMERQVLQNHQLMIHLEVLYFSLPQARSNP